MTSNVMYRGHMGYAKAKTYKSNPATAPTAVTFKECSMNCMYMYMQGSLACLAPPCNVYVYMYVHVYVYMYVHVHVHAHGVVTGSDKQPHLNKREFSTQ